MPSRAAWCLRRLTVWIVFLGVAAGSHAQLAFRVQDINTTKPRSLDHTLMSDLVTLGTTTLFVLDDGGTGSELWKIDGITGSTELLKDICPGHCGSSPLSLTVAGGRVFFWANDGAHGIELWKSDGTSGGTVMVRDINPGGNYASYGLLTSVDGVLYFAADDGVHGTELWTSDGTAAGTMLVADLNPGPAHSRPYFQASSQGRFLFTASDDSHGQEPWISDGTTAGTHRIRDLNPGEASSIPSPFPIGGDETALGLSDGTFLFGADDGTHGQELWRTDGTDAGTVLVKDIYPGVGASEPAGFTLLNGKVYFRAGTPDMGEELWATDGTEAGTALVKDISIGPFGARPERLTAVNGRLFFRAGFELWASDGTTEGTVLLTSNPLLAIGTLGSSVLALTAHPFNNFLRLWKTDGTPGGTMEVKNLGLQDSRCLSSRPDPKEINGSLFFYHCKRGVGLELWKTDGTTAGTVLAQSATQTPSFPTNFSSSGPFLATFGNGLFFSPDDGITGGRLWYSDGTPGAAQPVQGTPNGPNSWPDLRLSRPVQLGDALVHATSAGLLRIEASGLGSGLLGASVLSPEFFSPSRAGNLLFFPGHAPGTGNELWKTDATAAGTGLVKDIAPGSASTNIEFLGSLGSEVLFKTTGDELWKSNGTEAGTILLHDFQTGSGLTLYQTFCRGVLGDSLFFVSRDETTPDWGLWKTDGTAAGTVRVKSFEVPPGFTGWCGGLLTLGNRLFLRFNDIVHGEELWVSDGTEAGTRLLKDILPGAESSGIDWRPLPGQSLLYFVADDGVHGREQWVSDGTEAGTHLLKDVRPGAESSNIDWPFFFPEIPGSSDQPYFTADDGAHGRELWTTDGTEAGTRMVKDIRPGPGSSNADSFLVKLQDRFFFTADDGVHGGELWVTDGTDAGTRMVKDVLPGPESSRPYGFTPLGRTLVFTASDGVHGAEPWVTSGTETGTFMLQDIASGAQPSEPVLYTSAPPYVYFIADDGTSGTELWAARKAVLEPTFDDVHSNYWAWAYVEALAAAGITTGCAPGLYCPVRPVTRAEMAVFLIRGTHGSGFVPPPPAGTVFTDVPAGYWAAAWIEQLAADGITTGCAPSQFCPESHTSRDQMAVFLLRAIHGSGYTPPPATGTVFTDVPASYWAAAWIEQLAAEGITTGCAPNRYCPGDPVSRDQMAVFLTRAFDLPLP